MRGKVRTNVFLGYLFLLSVIFISSCGYAENEQLKADIAALKKRLRTAMRAKADLEYKLTIVDKKLEQALQEIEELRAKIKENAVKAEIEKKKAVQDALAQAEEYVREKKLERLKEKAQEREKARQNTIAAIPWYRSPAIRRGTSIYLLV